MSSTTAATIKELLQTGAPDAPAIGAPEREPLTYDGLNALVDETGQALNSFGRRWWWRRARCHRRARLRHWPQ